MQESERGTFAKRIAEVGRETKLLREVIVTLLRDLRDSGLLTKSAAGRLEELLQEKGGE